MEKRRKPLVILTRIVDRVINIGKINHVCHLLKRIKNMWVNPYLSKWDRNEVPKDQRVCILC